MGTDASDYLATCEYNAALDNPEDDGAPHEHTNSCKQQGQCEGLREEYIVCIEGHGEESCGERG